MYHYISSTRLKASHRQTLQELGIREGDTALFAAPRLRDNPAVEHAARRVIHEQLSVAAVARELSRALHCHAKTAARHITANMQDHFKQKATAGPVADAAFATPSMSREASA